MNYLIARKKSPYKEKRNKKNEKKKPATPDLHLNFCSAVGVFADP